MQAYLSSFYYQYNIKKQLIKDVNYDVDKKVLETLVFTVQAEVCIVWNFSLKVSEIIKTLT